MGCNPPYCMGTGSWCGCNCRCCPPEPCYTSWTYVYICGSSSSSYTPPGEEISQLCICAPDPPAFKAPSLEVEFPDFEYPLYMFGKQNDDGYVFAQTHEPDGLVWTEGEVRSFDYTSIPSYSIPSCSIPCVVRTITLTTSGCCLYGSGFSFVAVGAGTVSLSGCGDQGECANGDFGCGINGSTSGTSVFVPDCGSVAVDITPPITSEDGCCECCLINSYGSLLSSSTPFAIYKQRSLKTGVQKTYINKKKLIEKISKTRRR